MNDLQHPSRKRLVQLSLIMVVGLLALNIYTRPVLASGIWQGMYDNKSWDLEPFRERIMDIYTLFKAICAPLAVCSIVAGGFEVLLGSEQEQAKGFARIKYTLMAVIALYLLPTVINIGYEIAKQYIWDPWHPEYVR